MNEQYNKIIVETLLEFIFSKKIPYSQEHAKIRKYVFDIKLRYTWNLEDVRKDILDFNIFEPISKFNYGSGSLYLIEFKDELNNELFDLFLNWFKGTEYEELFFSSINKIIPINYCIQNQPWNIVKKILTVKKLQSNGLPTVEHTKLFFKNLSEYVSEIDFKSSLFMFCKQNKTLLKRIETQQYLKDLLLAVKDNNLFKEFIYFDENKPLCEIKQDFYTYYFDKNVLFSKLSHLVKDKYRPIELLDILIVFLNKTSPKQSTISKIFSEQKESEFKEFIVLVSFKEELKYKFEEYLFLLLQSYISSNQPLEIIAEKTTNFFFMEKDLKVKDGKEKINKI